MTFLQAEVTATGDTLKCHCDGRAGGSESCKGSVGGLCQHGPKASEINLVLVWSPVTHSKHSVFIAARGPHESLFFVPKERHVCRNWRLLIINQIPSSKGCSLF